MSIDLFVTALDLEAYQQVQGSRDRALLGRITAERRQELADHDAFRRDSGGPAVSLATVIERIIDGRVETDSIPLYLYEHAAAQIADALGAQLDSELLLEVHPELLDEVDCVLVERMTATGLPPDSWPTFDAILARGPLLRIPLDSANRLGTGYLTSAEIRRITTKIEEVDLDETELQELEWPEESLEILILYREWIADAAAQHHGLFFHR